MTQPKWNPMSQQFDHPLTLADFLLARIAEDEAAARGVYSLSVYWRTTTGGREFGPNVAYFEEPDDAVHVARWSPDRVLAECEAKRQIVAEHSVEVKRVSMSPFDPSTGEQRRAEWDATCRVCGWADYDPSGGCATLKLLALPYADHPDYREEWRP